MWILLYIAIAVCTLFVCGVAWHILKYSRIQNMSNEDLSKAPLRILRDFASIHLVDESDLKHSPNNFKYAKQVNNRFAEVLERVVLSRSQQDEDWKSNFLLVAKELKTASEKLDSPSEYNAIVSKFRTQVELLLKAPESLAHANEKFRI